MLLGEEHKLMFPWNFFPFNKETQQKMGNMNPEEMNQYVQNMINKIFNQSLPNFANPQDMMNSFSKPSQPLNTTKSNEDKSQLEYSIFDTHDFVFVRVKIEEEDWLQEIKLYHTSNTLIIENIPETGDRHSLTLPAIVKKKGTTALHKDRILEIKIVKNVDMQYSEIDISEY
jgi:HSP20 family molecular chaperone IbpA